MLPTPRPGRPRWGLALLCSLVSLVLSGCGGHDSPTPDGLVPWNDDPATAAQLTESATAPTCRVSALRLPRRQQRWGGVWNNAVAGYLMVENAGRHACELPRPSRVTARTLAGQGVAFDVGRLSTPAVVLDPGDRVQVQVSSPYDCGKPLVRSDDVTLTFPTGTLRIPGARMAVQCGGALVDFTARDTGSSGPDRTRTTPASRLTATISHIPRTIAPDGPVTYVVTLTNPTASTITFGDCPAYQEGIKGRPSSVHSFRLNCDAVPGIAPHSSTRFAMQLPLPSRLPPGPVVLDWKLQLPTTTVDDGQFASVETTVR